eukprot:sb/3463201/
MIQKKSHTLFTDLLNQLDKVRYLYENHALLLSEEASVISGLLVGINVIDCNLCLKESDLDSLPQVIQLRRYFRDGNHLEVVTPPGSPRLSDSSYQQVLDQKSYVEEINEKLKLDYQLTEKKSLMFQDENEVLSKEILAIKSELEEITSERDCLRQKCSESEHSFQRRLTVSKSNGILVEIERADIATERETYEASRSGLNELYLLAKAELAAAQERISHLESDLDMEHKIKEDVDKANGLLEKELRDKEDTIEALRKQCSDVKKLNLTMFSKVQDADKKIAEKTESLKNSEAKSEMSTSELSELQQRNKELDVENVDLKKELDIAKTKLLQSETALEQAQTGFGVEKEWRENLQKQCTVHREEISKLRADTTQVAEMKSALRQLKRENDDLKRSCSEQERALVELGDHLSRSKVKAEELKFTVEVAKDNKWVADNEATECQQCKKSFSVARRRISPDKFGAPPTRRGRKKTGRGGAADRTKCCNRREISALTELSDSDLLLPVEPTRSPSTPRQARVVGASQCKSARRPARARRRPPPQLIAEENSFTSSPVHHAGKRTQFANVLDTPPSRGESAVVYATNTPDHLMGVSMATRHRIARS